MNALDLLKLDHVRILTLFDQAENEVKSGNEKARPAAVEDLMRALRFHQKMMREVLYPELQKHPESRALVSSQTQHDTSLNELIDDIDRSQPPDSSRRLAELRKLWVHHTEQAESKLFPLAEQVLGRGKLLELFYEMDEIRSHQSGQDSAIYPASRLGPKT